MHLRAMVLLMFLLASAALAEEALKIEKAEAVVEYKRFDPKKLPDPAPPLQDGEKAVCEYKFFCDASIRYEPTIRAGAPEVAVRVSGVTVQLRLTITIWLPHDASPELKAHEEGHRTIAEHFYKEAEGIVRKLTGLVLATTFTLPAKEWESAAAKKVDALAETVYQGYLDAINAPCGKAQEEYDRITDHARAGTPTAEQALKRVLEKK